MLPLILTSALVFIGCSAGAGMQATPPASISQAGASTEYAPQTTTKDTGTEDLPEPDTQPPISQSVEGSAAEGTIPTGGGGRFLLL
jgi:hypothetical protein